MTDIQSLIEWLKEATDEVCLVFFQGLTNHWLSIVIYKKEGEYTLKIYDSTNSRQDERDNPIEFNEECNRFRVNVMNKKPYSEFQKTCFVQRTYDTQT